jgi:tetratricopeptide (TPR) repeat protein
MKNQTKDALRVLNTLIHKYNPNYPAAYELTANIFFMLGYFDKAETYLLKLVEKGVADEKTLGMILKLYLESGMNEIDAYVKLYSYMENHYRKVGEVELADEYKDAIEKLSAY